MARAEPSKVEAASIPAHASNMRRRPFVEGIKSKFAIYQLLTPPIDSYGTLLNYLMIAQPLERLFYLTALNAAKGGRFSGKNPRRVCNEWKDRG